MGLVYAENFQVSPSSPRSLFRIPRTRPTSINGSVSDCSGYTPRKLAILPESKCTSEQNACSPPTQNPLITAAVALPPITTFGAASPSFPAIESSILGDEQTKTFPLPAVDYSAGISDPNSQDLTDRPNILRCNGCHNQISLNKFVISTNFYGNYGPALFVSDVLNVKLSDDKSFQRMRTGRYVVKTIYCRQCQTNIGWKYLFSEEDGEKYKEGRFVIERTQLEEVPY